MAPRPPGRRRAGVALAIAALVVAAPGAVRAQAYAPERVERARTYFSAGVAAAHARNWPGALRAFSEAYALVPQPQTLFNLAAAQAATQRLVAATQSYQRFLREADTTPALAPRRAVVLGELHELARRTPRLRIACTAGPTTDPIALDGQPLAITAAITELPVDPGAHVVTATRAGLEVARAPFDAVEGELHVVTLALPAARPPPRITLRAIELAPPRPRPRAPTVLASPWFWLAAGVVVVGGTVAGLAASGALSPTVQGSLPSVDVH